MHFSKVGYATTSCNALLKPIIISNHYGIFFQPTFIEIIYTKKKLDDFFSYYYWISIQERAIMAQVRSIKTEEK